MKAQNVPRETPPPDMVSRPPHYTRLTPEPIDVLEAWGHVLGWGLYNVIKYVARCDAKGDALQDLRKAKVYLDREIARRERG